MNEFQYALVNVLEQFLKVCKLLDLKYYAANGTVLGALKYGGFIPWDDDIDIAMPREDYDIFCEKAKEYLPDYIFVQNYKTDKNFPLFYTKLRNSNTTFIETDVKHIDMNHGIYIDIFPLDGFPDGLLSRKKLSIEFKILRAMQFCGFGNSNKMHHKLLRAFGCHRNTTRILSRMEKIVKKVKSNSNVCCDYGDRQEKGCFSWDVYGNGLLVNFEHLELIVPEKFDEYLTYKYGDWRMDLPKEKQKTHHNVYICDLNVSYKAIDKR